MRSPKINRLIRVSNDEQAWIGFFVFKQINRKKDAQYKSVIKLNAAVPDDGNWRGTPPLISPVYVYNATTIQLAGKDLTDKYHQLLIEASDTGGRNLFTQDGTDRNQSQQ